MTWSLRVGISNSALYIWIIICIVVFSTNSTNLPCHFYDSINITDGIRQQNNQILYDGIVFPSNQYAIVNYTEDDGMKNITEPHLRGCFCNIKQPCHRFCCSNHQMVDGVIDARKNLENKCNEELNQLEEEVFVESSRLINLLLGNYTIYFENKTCIPFFTFEYYLNVMPRIKAKKMKMANQKNNKQKYYKVNLFIFQIKRQKFSHENKTLNTRGYCRTRIDQNTKIHFDVSICITIDEPTEISTANLYASLDRIEHIGM